ncbi:MAG: GapS4b family protein [Nitrososphaeraceae archaeon]
MEKIHDNINRFLPFGESLRAILQHDSIKDRERRQLLRLKGVFVNNSDEDSTFPILTTSLLSPNEFEFLKERLQSKEDREKTITRTLDWESKKTLIAAIPDNFNIQEIIKTNFPKYKVIGNPNFRMFEDNPNRITLDFKCETINYGKAWFRGKNEFKGQITFEKVKTKDNKVQLQIIHTSPETTEIAEKVSKNLEKHFKANNYMNPQKEIQRIIFKDFTNKERIQFFLSMTEGNDVFGFTKATFLDIGPDPSENLPSEINWLELAKVRELNINGEVLHNLPFLKDKTLHKFMELAEMEIIYDFSLPSVEGNCKIRFGFYNYFKKRIGNIELVVDFVKINPKDEYVSVPLASIKSQLFKEFEKFKTEKYEWCKLQNIASNTPATI